MTMPMGIMILFNELTFTVSSCRSVANLISCYAFSGWIGLNLSSLVRAEVIDTFQLRSDDGVSVSFRNAGVAFVPGRWIES
jgi:hypothetical protein